MGFCESVDKTQLRNLLVGMLGIYILYFIAGILHESIVKRPHYNRITKNYQICDNAPGLIFVPFFIAWIFGQIYNKIMLTQRKQIPHKNSALTAFAVVVATFFSVLAIQRTSFPVVIMFQSCSILPVVFIGVFCSRVHDPNLHLGPKKIIVALIIAAGILTFQFADPETKQRQTKEQFIGIVFLLFHFVAEGFLPDLQAEIKVNFKPQPTQMMADINKWCSLFVLVIALVTLNGWSFLVFMWQHISFTIDILAMSIVSGFGQFFIYRMIKQFKQHFVPFTISSRKILTATISIVFYGHKTNWIQILGICIVLFTVFVQFLMEISKKPKNKQQNKEIVHQLNEQKFQDDFKISEKSVSKQGSQKMDTGQNNSNQKSFHQQNKSYNLKNAMSQIIKNDNQQSQKDNQRETQQQQKYEQLSQKNRNKQKESNKKQQKQNEIQKKLQQGTNAEEKGEINQ